jgi:undecaprenyl-diphosphatase
MRSGLGRRRQRDRLTELGRTDVGIDTALFQAVHGLAHHNVVVDAVVTAYALWMGLAVLAALFVESWWRVARHSRQAITAVAELLLAGIGTVAALLVNQRLLSPLIARPRPCQVLPHVRPLLACNSDFSMPSDHAVIAGALAAGLLLITRRNGPAAVRRAVAAVVLALLLAVSRVYVGVHYPADTGLGLLVGAAGAVVFVVLLRRPAEAVLRSLSRTAVRPLIVAGGVPEPSATVFDDAHVGRRHQRVRKG